MVKMGRSGKKKGAATEWEWRVRKNNRSGKVFNRRSF